MKSKEIEMLKKFIGFSSLNPEDAKYFMEEGSYGWFFFPAEEEEEKPCPYEDTILAETHRELNSKLGWFTIDHGFECSECGAPWGPACDCGYDPEGNLLPAEQVPPGQPRECFEINVNQLFAGHVDNLPLGTRVKIYPAEGKIEIK